ncbi:MAG: hypothetical protein P8Z80_15020 [Pseudolabrys sp.]
MSADSPLDGVKAFFFDAFGTLMDWRRSVAREAERGFRELEPDGASGSSVARRARRGQAARPARPHRTARPAAHHPQPAEHRLSDTTRKVYRHDPVGLGDVPFADVPAALAAVGYRARPMLEIISTDPDRDIPASTDRLAALGFAAPAVV